MSDAKATDETTKSTDGKTNETMNKNPYNGWTNYETWAVNLWMDNEQGAQAYWSEQATEALERADGDVDDATTELAESMQDEHEQALPELHGFAADLLNAAMSEVNWREIAQHLVEAAKEEAAL